MPNPVIVRRLIGGSPPVPLSQGLAAYWRFDTSPGGVTPDATGNGNNLTITGTGTINASGLLNSAYGPTSATDIVSGAANSTKLGPTDSFTITAWIQPGVGFGNQQNFFVARGDTTGALDYRLAWITGGTGFQASVTDTDGNVYSLSDGTTATDVNTYTSGFTNHAWYFLAMGFDFALGQLWLQVNNGPRLYLTGVPNVRQSFANLTIDNLTGVTTVAVAGIDETGFWKRSLSTGEIFYLYGSGATPPIRGAWTVPDFSSFTSTFIAGGGSAMLSYADSIVNRWAAQVITNGGAALSAGTKAAHSTFANGLMSDRILMKLGTVNTFAPDNLIAGLTPLIPGGGNVLWTNVNGFVLANLTVNGLVGNASKYLRTGFAPSSLPSTLCGAALYMFSTGSDGAGIGSWSDAPGTHRITLTPHFSDGNCYGNNGTGMITVNSTGKLGFFADNRESSTVHKCYFANAANAFAQLGATDAALFNSTQSTLEMYVFAQNGNGSVSAPCSDRYSFAAAYAGMSAADLANLYTRVQALRTALGGGFI